MDKMGIRKLVIALFCVYCMTQGLLLVVSGRWWDDWSVYMQTSDQIHDLAYSAGRPSLYFIYTFANMVPEPTYRFITFFMFFGSTLFFGGIVNNIFGKNDKRFFLTCLLFMLTPVNDSRILLSTFAYSVGLFFFMWAFWLLTHWITQNKLKWYRRMITLLLFTLSFILNSNLFLYALPFLYLLYISIRKKGVKGIFQCVDYAIIPILYFGIKCLCFKPYGVYAEYNQISVEGIFFAVIHIVPATFVFLKNIISNFMISFSVYKVDLLVTGLAFLLINRKRIYGFFRKEKEICAENNNIENETGDSKKISCFICGLFALAVALFPYVVIRQSNTINTSGTAGRDAISTPIGIALIIYSLVEMIFKERVKKYVYIVLTVGGVFYFNLYYLSYQNDFYRNQGFKEQLSVHSQLDEAENILYLNEDDALINIQSLNGLNGAAYLAYNNQKHAVFGGKTRAEALGDIQIMQQFASVSGNRMLDYSFESHELDAIVIYSYNPSLKNCLKTRYLEMVNSDRYREQLVDNSSIEIIWKWEDKYQEYLER
ncbi:MAG: hypothetical protein ACI4F8_01860 [Lachnospiraceae bacterium]